MTELKKNSHKTSLKDWFENNFDIATVLIPQGNGGYKSLLSVD